MKKPISRIISIKSIAEDEDLYPRNDYSWQVAYDYSESLKAGASFPPIIVNEASKGRYILIDGKHRIEALKLNKQKHVSAKIFRGMNKKDMYVMAVQANITHGKTLSVQEKATACLKLKDLKCTLTEISKIVQIPTHKLKSFVGNRITNTLTGETIVLKKPLKHLAGRAVKNNTDFVQHLFSGDSQTQLVDEMITLLENKLLDKKNKKLMLKLKHLKKLLYKMKF